jgi:hypothetical protein
VVASKTLVQPIVALSTAGSELLAASDTGRLGLFIRAMLDKLVRHQHVVMNVYEDNSACQMVTDSPTPTCQMHHITIRDFALQDWTERNIITLTARASNANASDMIAKQVGKNLIACHNHNISGRTTFFRINYDLLLVPRHPSGSRGGCWCPCRSCLEFPDSRNSNEIHSLE